MNKKDVKVAKDKILMCLTTDFTYGKTVKGTPLKQPKLNHALFIADGYGKGEQIYNDTNLEMVMEAVVLGLYFAMADTQGNEHEDT